MSVFKAYDIRGLAGSQLDAEFAERLGAAIVTHLGAERIAVARDIRESGPELHTALLSGITSAGADVLDLGITSTGVLYRATTDLDVDASIAITASHNPPEYNGFKICRGRLPMAGEELQDLKETFDSGEFNVGSGVVTELQDFQFDVLDTIIENAGKPSRPMKVAIDCGNAVPGPLAVELMRRMDVDLVPVHCSWDNSFPNHPPDPTRPDNMHDLSAAVVGNGCEFGIGMDGDGDRIGVVDESGKFIHPDRLMTIFARDILSGREGMSEEERTVFYDVKCSLALENSILESGGVPKMVRTGHSFMKRELERNPLSPLAGEMSGHFFIHDKWPGFDCSLYNTARLLEIVGRDPSPSDGGPSFSDRFSSLPDYPSTGEAKIPLPGDREEIMGAVSEAFSDMKCSTVDGIRVRYEGGWFLCRPSNTESILVMRAEGMTDAALRRILADVDTRIGHIADLSALHYVPAWRPRAMSASKSDNSCPTGFHTVNMAGIGMSALFFEPTTIREPDDWETVILDLEPWGEVPSGEIQSLTYEETPRGPVVRLEADGGWTAEFLPWGSDGLIRARSKHAPSMCDTPCGGYYWDGRDMIIMRKSSDAFKGLDEELLMALRDNDADSSIEILNNAGAQLGMYHSAVGAVRATPPDQKRWNSRNEAIERVLRAQFIWRAPFTKEQPCTLSLLDVRFSDISDSKVRIGRPRLADAFRPHESEKPGMRDLASLMHDLSRIYYESKSTLGITGLRLSLIDGWKSTAPVEWGSDAAFYSYRGGIAIWEYEQCLLDVIEATSHQSGAPEPSVTMLKYVKSYQKGMFNNRTFAALSVMSFFFAATTLLSSLPPSPTEILTPAFLALLGFLCLKTYRNKSPPPESPFNGSFGFAIE